ncbi:MAG: B12-binding domain-containing radical SAM protein [Lachnospiraceae bacterium]|nr:B12-binding domain-containing radical SAM protein [Lachnospiraceae bacterium]
MKILLTAINAKYIHSNPAVYSLRAYALKADKSCHNKTNRGGDEESAGHLPEIEIAEYTINNRREELLADIYRRKPDVIAFSCYIWNWSMVSSLLPELPKILPECAIWLGGPEVSYHSEELLQKYPMVTGIMLGEGEETFYELARYYSAKEKILLSARRKAERKGYDEENIRLEQNTRLTLELDKIDGIVYHIGDVTVSTGNRKLTDLSKLPFLYDNLDSFENKIIYYESSRGCPYRCSYCLSSIDKKVRLRDITIVKKELQFFLDNKVKQVKFVDRTFNCNHKHAKAIWQYLLEHDNGVTNFHFEIEADIITEEELEILSKMRQGLIQMEIGVQTFNPVTLQEIRRTTDMEKLRYVVERIHAGRNIHVHLDLIAGLPYEDYESFIHSFNEVYSMNPEQLQLGFLKVLKGAYMEEKAEDYEMKYLDTPPYEVLSTKWLPYDKVLLLKQVEEMVELYYNSNQFTYTLPVLQTVFEDAYSMYRGIAGFYEENGYFLASPARSYRYQVLFDFAKGTKLREQEDLIRQVLTFDLYLRENVKSRPDFARDLSPYKERIRQFYEKEAEEYRYLPEYKAYDSRQMSKMTHMEMFDYPVWEEDIAKRMNKMDEPCMVLFDYRSRDALTYEARFVPVRD